MGPLLIGVDAEDLRLPVKEGIRRAAEMAFRCVELPAGAGEIAPRNLSTSGRRHLVRYVKDHGLSLAALTADISGSRLTDPRTVAERVERTCEIIDLARELSVPIVTAAVGALTHPESGEPSEVSLSALRQIGERADSRGIVYAVRPSHDNPDRLRGVFDALRCSSIQIGLDPAAMIMAGTNPGACLEEFADQVALVHARDATAGLRDRPGRETVFSKGEVDFAGIVGFLSGAEYRGPYIARRYDTQTPMADLVAARHALSDLMAG